MGWGCVDASGYPRRSTYLPTYLPTYLGLPTYLPTYSSSNLIRLWVLHPSRPLPHCCCYYYSPCHHRRLVWLPSNTRFDCTIPVDDDVIYRQDDDEEKVENNVRIYVCIFRSSSSSLRLSLSLQLPNLPYLPTYL